MKPGVARPQTLAEGGKPSETGRKRHVYDEIGCSSQEAVEKQMQRKCFM